jgi:hypothetical protein
LPKARGDCEEADESGGFHEDLASIEQIRVAVLQIWIRENAVQQQQHGRGKDQIVQVAPKGPADARAQQG